MRKLLVVDGLIKQYNKIHYLTYGCKVNQFDTDKIKSIVPNSFEESSDLGKSDICIINTCTVTDATDNQILKDLRKIKKDFPKIKTLVTGCLAQTTPEVLKASSDVDFIVDNANKYLIPKVLNNLEAYENEVVSDIFALDEFDDFDEGIKENRSRAFLKIQDGCNYRCSFCIIPFARGKSRSMNNDSLLDKISYLHDCGFNEVVLTGIHLSSYGLDRNQSLLELLQKIEKYSPIKNIRLSSIDPADTSLEMIDFISQSEKICPSFHISMQSGNNEILREMRRRYKISSFTKLTNYIRDCIPDACIGTDVIVGFPGETEDLFLETYNYIKNSELNYLHVFPYSDRKGTRASLNTDKIDNFDKKLRSKKLRMLADKLKEEFQSKYIGKTLIGIKEKNNKVRTRNYIDVNIADSRIEQGRIVKVKIDEILNKKVLGSIIPQQG